MKKAKSILGISLLVTSLVIPVRALEHWDINFTDQIRYPQAITEFKGELYVFGSSPGLGLLPFGIWKSKDGLQWQKVWQSEAPIHIEVSFAKHGDTLYFFYEYFNHCYVAQSSDGITWKQVLDTGFLLNPAWMGSASYGDYLYVGQHDGRLLRTLGGTDPQWETLNPWPDLLEAGVWSITLFEFKGALHAAVTTYPSGILGTLDYKTVTKLYRSSLGNSWELVSTFDPVTTTSIDTKFARPQFRAFEGKLYASNVDSWVTDGGTPSYIWTKEDLTPGYHLIPEIFGHPHRVIGNQPLKILSEQGTWQDVTQERFYNLSLNVDLSLPPTIPVRYCYSAEVGKKAYLLLDNLRSLQLGVTKLISRPLPAGTLYAGQSAVVLALTVEANIWDDLVIRLKNWGTALGVRDIARLKLIRSQSSGNSAGEVLVEFHPDPNDPTSWIGSAKARVRDGDNLLVVADINSSPEDKTTCLFSIAADGLQSTNNETFALEGTLISGQTLEINSLPASSASAAIAEILVSPSPARDQVTFLYSLDTPADVTIKIFDREGILVSEINDPGKPAGLRVKSMWDASQKAPGTYYATVEITNTGEKRRYKKMVFIKR